MSYDKEAAERKLDFGELDIITLQKREQKLELDGKGNTIMPSDQYMELRDKYCELIQMIKDEKFIKLPCQVRDEVFYISNDKIKSVPIVFIGIEQNFGGGIELVFHPQNHFCNWCLSDFGKTVFLTEEEAKNKLKEC